jgi:hypothetical protein
MSLRIYPGREAPVDPRSSFNHDPERYYFCPSNYSSNVPFSHAFESPEAAELALNEYASRAGEDWL